MKHNHPLDDLRGMGEENKNGYETNIFKNACKVDWAK